MGCNLPNYLWLAGFKMVFLARYLKFLPDRFICEICAELLNLLRVAVWPSSGLGCTRPLPPTPTFYRFGEPACSVLCRPLLEE
jgi:hypothetical protein